MKNSLITPLLAILLLITSIEAVAFRLIVKTDAKLKHLSVGEHSSTAPVALVAGVNKVRLEHYPNAVHLLYYKGSGNFKFLPMIWVASDTSTVEIMVDGEYNVQFARMSSQQAELNAIFAASNKWSLFPYTPGAERPLEPILVLEAKAMIQNLNVETDRSVLENLVALSKSRNISNWSTAAITAYLNESPETIYKNKTLIRIFGLDSLTNTVDVKPDKAFTLVAISGSWCGPCVKGIPDIRKMYDHVREKVLFVSLWNDPNLVTFTNFHRHRKKLITWPSLWDQYGLMANALQVTTYPTYILFDRNGTEMKRWEGKFPGSFEDSIKQN